MGKWWDCGVGERVGWERVDGMGVRVGMWG